MMSKLIAFDCDHTLSISEGPIPLESIIELKNHGAIVGICGNWPVVVKKFPNWHDYVSFMGGVWNPYEWSQVDGPRIWCKSFHLLQWKQYIKADDYVMVGNTSGSSAVIRCDSSTKFDETNITTDQTSAHKAGFKFIKESDFNAWKKSNPIHRQILDHFNDILWYHVEDDETPNLKEIWNNLEEEYKMKIPTFVKNFIKKELQ